MLAVSNTVAIINIFIIAISKTMIDKTVRHVKPACVAASARVTVDIGNTQYPRLGSLPQGNIIIIIIIIIIIVVVVVV